MKIAIIGYGRMGHVIEEMAKERGHEIVATIDSEWESLPDCDVAIEFTQPDQAVKNIIKCLELGIPIVSGTTGWLKDWDKVQAYVEAHNGSFFYSSNFSVGIHLFRKVVTLLSKYMNGLPEYSDIEVEEVHHTKKLDYPSGTALSIAQDIVEQLARKSEIVSYLEPAAMPKTPDDTLVIRSIREGDVPGIHQVTFESQHDIIRLEHEAYDRNGLAEGAVKAAEFLATGKKGIYGMDDLIRL